jgi:hypothetical protein
MATDKGKENAMLKAGALAASGELRSKVSAPWRIRSVMETMETPLP